MSLLGAALTFIILIILISRLRTRLYFEFVGLSLLILKTKSLGKWLYSLIFLPGTIIHELSHWLIAELLGVRTGEISVLPDFEENGKVERLGSVATSQTGPLRGFLIGIAPFLVGLTILWILGQILTQNTLLFWQTLLLLYGVIVTSSSMLLSPEDRRNWPFIIIFILILITLAYVTNLTVPPQVSSLLDSVLSSLNKIIFYAILAIFGVIGALYLIRRIIERLLRKKVVRS